MLRSPFLVVLAFALQLWLVCADYEGVTINLNGTLSCQKDGSFCAGESNKTQFIIYCKDGVGTTDVCSFGINGQIYLTDSEKSPTCVESSRTSGNAKCYFDGHEYDASSSGKTVGQSSPSSSIDPAGFVLKGMGRGP